ncbi:MAG: hypothetical protein RIR70_1465 [Pseudomonadota bacterium]|jgi:ElaB/YqjD/DUF883 family membrane-anchored ribosome-binding protein
MKAEEFNGTAAAVGMSARERLQPDLKALVQDVNAVMRDASEAAGLGLGAAKARVAQTTSKARAQSENMIHRHPWRAVAVVAGVGVMLGWLLSRRG